MKKDDTLYGYVAFTSKARRFEQGGMNRADAVKAAAEECIKEGILKEYLENNASEVINMLTQEWDWDKAMEVNARNAERRVREEMAEYVAGIVADKDAKIATIVADRDAKIADKDAKIADKDAEIARLRAQLEKKA